MRTKVGLGMVLAAGGCGPGRDTPGRLPEVEYVGAGSRLAPIVASAEGGADYLLDWFDLELQTPCTFTPSTDGRLRCLPRSQGSIRYADPACTQPVATPEQRSCPGAALESEPRFFWQASGCATEVYRPASAAPVGEGSAYLRASNGGCQLDVESRLGPQSLRLEQAPPSEWVAAALGPGATERSPGMKPWLLTAEDGAWEIRGFFDTQRGTPCALPENHAGVADRCLPMPHAELPVRSDAVCGQPGTGPAECREAPLALYSVLQEEEDCSPPRLQVWEAERGACGASEAGYVPGRAIGLEELPRIERLHAGTGRLQLQFQGHAGVPYFPDASARRPFSEAFAAAYVDSRYAERCWPERIAGDRYLCLSGAWAEAEPLAPFYYASCLEEPLELRSRRTSAASCSAPPPALRGFWSLPGGEAGRTCPAPVADAGYELRGARAFAGDVIYQPMPLAEPGGSASCYEQPPEDGIDYFLPAEPLARDLVAELVVRILLPGSAP